MNKLYIVTGPAGVGKSTISSNIVGRSLKSCLIDGDDIYHLVKGGYVNPWLDGNHLVLFWQNIVSLVENSLKNGYDVVFNYIIEKNDVNIFLDKFPLAEKKLIVLIADEETILLRDKMRSRENQMGERCLILLNQMINAGFEHDYILDTSKLTVEKTIEQIINEQRFLL